MKNSQAHWKRNAVLFLSSQVISLFGSSMVQYAILWHITLTARSGSMMMISTLCGFLPTFFLSPFAGVWADRHDRRLLIVAADTAIAAVTLAVAVLYSFGVDSFLVLFAALALRSVGAAVHAPAVNAFIPQFVPQDALVKVNGTYQSVQSGVMLVSPILAGLLLSIAPLEATFFIDVATAAVAVSVLLLVVRVPARARAAAAGGVGYFADLREGIAYIRGHGYVKRFFAFCVFFFFLITPAAFLTPLQVVRTFGGDVWRLTAIEVVFSVGMMAGGLLVATWGGFRNRVHTMALASFSCGLLTVGLGLVPHFVPYLAVMGVFGIAIPLFNTPATVLLQEHVEDAFLGRVFGVMGMISSIMMPLGMLVFGPMADAVRIEWLLVGSGIPLFGIGFFLVVDRVLLAAGRAPSAAASAQAAPADTAPGSPDRAS
jgi:DHA3 family macrolide efflux protein-like MFS transporter